MFAAYTDEYFRMLFFYLNSLYNYFLSDRGKCILPPCGKIKSCPFSALFYFQHVMIVHMEITASTSVDSVGDQNLVIKQLDIARLEVNTIMFHSKC